MKAVDLYESVTRNIIEQLEQGAAPWVKSWTSQGSAMPRNAISKRPYSGVNILILWLTAEARGYASQEWMTFKQAMESGGMVRKGEKSTAVVFVKKIPGRDQEENEDPKLISILRVFNVFNRAQVDGLPEAPQAPVRPLSDRYAAVESFLKQTGANVAIGPYEPCYVPSLDQVRMPPREAFQGDEHYYATALHEHVHWTGPRLERDLTGRFGTEKYAAEELVAELGAAFLCAHLEIEGQLRHAGYIQSWLKLLKADPRAIFTAAAKASQAADYLRNFGEEYISEAA